MRLRSVSITIAALTLAAPALASAATVEQIALPGPAYGVTLGPDGAIWAALWQSDRLARIAPDGSVTQSAALGGAPLDVAVISGKLWVTLFDARKIAIVNPSAPASFPFTVSTPAGQCKPVALAELAGKAYFSMPNDGQPGCTMSSIGSISITGTGPVGVTTGLGQAFDLLSADGNLFIPDFNGDRVRRTNSALAVTATYTAPAGGQPDGVAADQAGTSSSR